MNRPFHYGSVCSGIEAATVAWEPLGWQAAFFSEIDDFPRAVLRHHYPRTPLHHDFTTIKEHEYEAIDLLVGGTPCQAFSVAGLRRGYADERGQLTREFVRLAERLRPRWLVWENVPGVLSIDQGRAFGALLGGLAERGYGFAYRILDAQYFGVPQRRRRVFVVGYLGDWRPPAAVLFERDGLLGNLAPSRAARTSVAARTANGLGTCGANDGPGSAGQRMPILPYTLVVRGRADATRLEYRQDGTANAILTPSGGRAGIGVGAVAIPIAMDQPAAAGELAVRRLTPRECERLQGFPDDYTLIMRNGQPAADGPRYQALGNSMAVPVMSWIGGRIDQVRTTMESLAVAA